MTRDIAKETFVNTAIELARKVVAAAADCSTVESRNEHALAAVTLRRYLERQFDGSPDYVWVSASESALNDWVDNLGVLYDEHVETMRKNS